MGVVRIYRCNRLVGVVARRYIYTNRFPHITYPYSTCISSIFAAASLLLCSFKKCFFVLVIIIISGRNVYSHNL